MNCACEVMQEMPIIITQPPISDTNTHENDKSIITEIREELNNNPKDIRNIYVTYDFIDEKADRLMQVDGIFDNSMSDISLHVPDTLGQLDCDADLFEFLTLCRGLDNILPMFKSHALCDHKIHSQLDSSCFLCLLRSFIFRINNIKKKTPKCVKPTEINSIIEKVRSVLKITGSKYILQYFMKNISSNGREMVGEIEGYCKKCKMSNEFDSYLCVEEILPPGSNMSDIVYSVIKKRIGCKCNNPDIHIKKKIKCTNCFKLQQPN